MIIEQATTLHYAIGITTLLAYAAINTLMAVTAVLAMPQVSDITMICYTAA